MKRSHVTQTADTELMSFRLFFFFLSRPCLSWLRKKKDLAHMQHLHSSVYMYTHTHSTAIIPWMAATN